MPRIDDYEHSAFDDQKYYETTAPLRYDNLTRRCRFKNCDSASIVEGYCAFHYGIICQHETRYLLKKLAYSIESTF